MSLTTSLLHARSGMIAAQSGLDVVSRNIANAETEGYTKKSHNQENLVIGGVASFTQLHISEGFLSRMRYGAHFINA